MTVSDDRFLNLGKALTLSTGTTIRVRELSFLKVLEILELLPGVIDIFESAKDGETDEMQLLANLMKSDKTRSLIKQIIEILTGIDRVEVEYLSTTDVLKILAELKGAMSWVELKELFFRVVPRESLDRMREVLQETVNKTAGDSSESSTPSSQPTDGVTSMS